MSTKLISKNIWPQITEAVHSSHQSCLVAVAYFGAGASRLLPLPSGSRLVVDASDRAVASGQTCPSDLIKVAKRGVAVYSVPNLHAKVFVLGRTAFVGSANVSNRSASQLVEAVIRTTDSGIVLAGRAFVNDHCLYELTPTVLKRLAKLYRPPVVPLGNGEEWEEPMTSKRPTLPRLLLAQVRVDRFSERELTMYDAGLLVAYKRRQHTRTFQLDGFIITDKCPYRCGDVVIQVNYEEDDSVLVAPPGNVVHIRTGRDGKRKKFSVYIERPSQRRRPVSSLARTLGRGALKRLCRDGVIRDAAFAKALLNVWVR